MFADLMIRGTIWLSVLAWAWAEVLKRGGAHRRAAARGMWTAGAILLALHTLAAFDLRHHWSHAAALAETARRSEEMTGVASGAGLYLNYLFVATWLADTAWWWWRPATYPRRPRALDLAVLAFFLFMFVNGAIVFAHGAGRVVGVVGVTIALWARFAPPRQ